MVIKCDYKTGKQNFNVFWRLQSYLVTPSVIKSNAIDLVKQHPLMVRVSLQVHTHTYTHTHTSLLQSIILNCQFDHPGDPILATCNLRASFNPFISLSLPLTYPPSFSLSLSLSLSPSLPLSLSLPPSLPLTSKSGSPNSTFRSIRPGLIRAGSSVSGLFECTSVCVCVCMCVCVWVG